MKIVTISIVSKITCLLSIALFIVSIAKSPSHAAQPLRCGKVAEPIHLGRNFAEMRLQYFLNQNSNSRQRLWHLAANKAQERVEKRECKKFIDAGHTCKIDRLEIKPAVKYSRGGKTKYALPILDRLLAGSSIPAIIGGNIGSSNEQKAVVLIWAKARRCSGSG